ncbi:hypothetical protein ACWX0K_13080 [Nitrobacteraceae bacterium UC4446_H13]
MDDRGGKFFAATLPAENLGAEQSSMMMGEAASAEAIVPPTTLRSP